MFTEANNLRCADCGTTSIVLEGQGEWDRLTQKWVMRQPATNNIEGVLTPIDETDNFFCKDCGDNVGVEMGEG